MKKSPENEKRRKITRADLERTIYIIMIVVLAIYGLRHSEAAVNLINALKDAFSLLLNTAP